MPFPFEGRRIRGGAVPVEQGQGARERGVDGVITYPVMLMELMRQVDVNKNYERSDVCQLLRILKTYDLLRDPQLELFKGQRRRKRT